MYYIFYTRRRHKARGNVKTASQKTLGAQGGTDRQPPSLFEKDGRYYLAAEAAQDTDRILSEYGGRHLKAREETLTEHARLISEDVFRDIYFFLS